MNSTVPPANPVLDQIRQAFPSADECFQTLTEKQFCIYDHAEIKRCYVQTDPDGIKHFTVMNPSGTPVHVLAIDGCLMSPTDPSRCDCAVLDEKTLCLVEIKTVSLKQRQAKRKQAEDQLKGSIAFFRENLTLPETQLEAYVCLLDYKTFGPCVRSSSVSRVLEFEELGVSLFYSNEKHFL